MRHFFFLPGSKRSIPVDHHEETPVSEEIQEPLYPFEHDINTMDGAEFLDDNLRMTDQPLTSTVRQSK